MARTSRDLGVVAEQGLQGGAAPGQPRLDGADGDAGLRGDLGHRQVAQVVQHERPALGLGQLPEGGHQGHVVGGRLRRWCVMLDRPVGWPA